MNRTSTLRTIFAFFLLAPISAVYAVSVDFTDAAAWSGASGNNPYTSPVLYGGIGVTASADPADAGLYWDSTDGLGVDPERLFSYENDEIEGEEILTISFSQMVRINEIGLSDLFIERGFTEMGSFWVDGDSSTSWNFFSDTSGNNGEVSVDVSGLNLLAMSISFSSPGRIIVPGYDGIQDHEYSLQNLDITAVPIPATIWLFGTALLGFIGFSRRTTI